VLVEMVKVTRLEEKQQYEIYRQQQVVEYVSDLIERLKELKERNNQKHFME
jgi:hypothetical protein